MTGTLWLLLVVTGVGLMWAMRYTRHALLDAVLVRASAFSFVGAGIVGAGGWIGGLLSSLVGAVNSAGAALGMAAIGTAAVWIAWLAMTVMWVLTLLPERWFGRSIPDWLAFAGLVLPGLAASIPGPLGNGLHQAVVTCGNVMVQACSRAFGMGG